MIINNDCSNDNHCCKVVAIIWLCKEEYQSSWHWSKLKMESGTVDTDRSI